MDFFSEEFMARMNRQNEIEAELIEQGVPFITAITKAGDMQSAEQATAMVLLGKLTPCQAVNYIGSFARFDWAVANLPKIKLMKMLPGLWRQSDPDDTKPEYLALWKDAWVYNERKTVCDGDLLPTGMLTVYRGQVGDKVGISWTLDKDVAQFFAKNGGSRDYVKGGVILERTVDSRDVLAYLTQRGESEVIIDPEVLHEL